MTAQLRINVPRFTAFLPKRKRWRVASALQDVVFEHRKRLNSDFFAAPVSYLRQPIHEMSLRIPDLFSPNICAIDFALEYLNREKDLILDYGCGLGVCTSYLTEIGFRAVGYDNWTQLQRNATDEMQERLSRPAKIVDSLDGINPTVLLHVSIWCSDPAVWNRPSVEWILSDSHYLTSFSGGCPDGFSIFGEYKGFLTAFHRK